MYLLQHLLKIVFLLASSLDLHITSILLTHGYRYHTLRKYLESSSGHTLSFCPNFVNYRFNNSYVFEGISHPVFFGLVNKLRRVKCAVNFVSFGPKIVKCFRCRKYDPVIIEKTTLVWPFYSLVQIFHRSLLSD